MNSLEVHKKICCQFAELLSYPDGTTKDRALSCQRLLHATKAQGAEPLQHYIDVLESKATEDLEELFTATFDLQPSCYPYVGYQLCGESSKRTFFLMQMRQLYDQYDFDWRSELPDHLSEMLRFIGTIDDQKCRQELINDGLVPALEKIMEKTDDFRQPYQAVLKALHSFLQQNSED